MRIFIAVEISPQAREQVAQRIVFMRERFADLRVVWEKPEKLHLTVKFLGEIDENKLPAVIAATSEAARAVELFNLTIERAGAFPPGGATRVLWLGVADASENLKLLNQRLEENCAAIGFAPETRAFKPHLTVARLKEPRHARELVNLHLQTRFAAARFRVDEMIVFQSELARNGSLYTALHKSKLHASY